MRSIKFLFLLLTSFFFISTACAEDNTNSKGDKMKIKIQITSNSGAHTLNATLCDNSSGVAFYEFLKKGALTIKMKEYGNFEKIGSLGTTLPTNDTYITANVGDILLYQGNQISLFYNTNSWSYTQLGKIDGPTQNELKSILDKNDITAVFEIIN